MTSKTITDSHDMPEARQDVIPMTGKQKRPNSKMPRPQYARQVRSLYNKQLPIPAEEGGLLVVPTGMIAPAPKPDRGYYWDTLVDVVWLGAAKGSRPRLLPATFLSNSGIAPKRLQHTDKALLYAWQSADGNGVFTSAPSTKMPDDVKEKLKAWGKDNLMTTRTPHTTIAEKLSREELTKPRHRVKSSVINTVAARRITTHKITEDEEI